MQYTGQRLTKCGYLHPHGFEISYEDAVREPGARYKGSNKEEKRKMESMKFKEQLNNTNFLKNFSKFNDFLHIELQYKIHLRYNFEVRK